MACSIEMASSHPQARVLLVSHVFGARSDLSLAVKIARQNDLILVEDCAECFNGLGWRGDPRACASLFSFGPIKYCCCFGGAMAVIRSEKILMKARQLVSSYPLQSRADFLWRATKIGVLSAFQGPFFCKFSRASHCAADILIVWCRCLGGANVANTRTGSSNSFGVVDSQLSPFVNIPACQNLAAAA